MVRVGFCGMGTMGAAMAANLARAGFPLTVWNRTPGPGGAAGLARRHRGRHPAGAAAASDIVVLCVSDTPDVEAVLFGDDGAGRGAGPGLPGHRLLHDRSGGDPQLRGAPRRAQGVAMVDAPVSGGSEGAQKGTLTIMVGGEDGDVERARPVLEAMGTLDHPHGPVGAGQATKAVNQVILCGTYLGVAEGMVLAIKSGLDPDKVVARAVRRRGPSRGCSRTAAVA